MDSLEAAIVVCVHQPEHVQNYLLFHDYTWKQSGISEKLSSHFQIGR